MTRLIALIFACSLALLWTSGCAIDHHGHPVLIIDDYHHHDRGHKKGHGKHGKHNKSFLKIDQKH